MKLLKLIAVPFTLMEDVVTFVPRSWSDPHARPRTVELIQEATE